MKTIITFLLLLSLCACKQQTTITNAADYDAYLASDSQEQTTELNNLIKVWNTKLDKDSLRIVPLSKLAQLYTQRFEQKGTIADLKHAEKTLLRAVDIAAINKANYLSALTRNYISQHRFSEAWKTLNLAEKNGALPRTLDLQRFDVAMELGNYTEAKKHLVATIDYTDFDYLIRLAKWKDHTGDLSSTILYMKSATQMAERAGLKSRIIWCYTNLGDYYGHAGELTQSYEYYLKALALDGSNAYAKKGLAWIAFSGEGNTTEAKRIIAAIQKKHQTPDYNLILAEIAEVEGDIATKYDYLKGYLNDIENPDYGVMYNAYTAQILSDDAPDYTKAILMAQQEVAQRPTTNSYALLAYTLHKSGDTQAALAIVEKHLKKEGLEPTVLYQIATIYQSNEQYKEVASIKKELLESTFELGPAITQKIKQL